MKCSELVLGVLNLFPPLKKIAERGNLGSESRPNLVVSINMNQNKSYYQTHADPDALNIYIHGQVTHVPKEDSWRSLNMSSVDRLVSDHPVEKKNFIYHN